MLTTIAAWPGPAWFNDPLIRWPVTLTYLAIILLVSVYGMHRYWLVWLYYRNLARLPRSRERMNPLPSVTVQLPMYNESQVAARVIDSACRLDYPRNLLQIQVLDDSTDGSDQIARQRVAYWAAQGVDIELIHRRDRAGFKAGALAAATPAAKGRFIAIFDADFVPQSGFLKRTIHHFSDPKVGMVQTRWGHINRDDSLLTRCQAIFLDGHFVIEHTARNRADRWINFNGTAGVWRREAIDAAGGWQADTLTEDVDLSYRAQLAGWRFVFLQRVTCPAELPPEINAFKAQQHRWTKGSIQTAIKLLPRLLRSDASLGVKVEAFFHLTSPMVYLYITLMALMFYPVFHINMHPAISGPIRGFLFGMSVFAMGTASAAVFYTASQRAQRRGWLTTVLHLPVLMSIGVGIALNNARGCIEALLGHESPFVRTPKYNAPSTAALASEDKSAKPPPLSSAKRLVLPTPSIKLWMGLIEVLMGLYVLLCAAASLGSGHPVISTPFLLLFAIGYLYVGLTSLWSQRQSSRGPRLALPQPV